VLVPIPGCYLRPSTRDTVSPSGPSSMALSGIISVSMRLATRHTSHGCANPPPLQLPSIAPSRREAFERIRRSWRRTCFRTGNQAKARLS
jgi:hypothetical protein